MSIYLCLLKGAGRLMPAWFVMSGPTHPRNTRPPSLLPQQPRTGDDAVNGSKQRAIPIETAARIVAAQMRRPSARTVVRLETLLTSGHTATPSSVSWQPDPSDPAFPVRRFSEIPLLGPIIVFRVSPPRYKDGAPHLSTPGPCVPNRMKASRRTREVGVGAGWSQFVPRKPLLLRNPICLPWLRIYGVRISLANSAS